MEIKAKHYKLSIVVLFLIIIGMFFYYEVWSKPSTTLDMYYLLKNEDYLDEIDEHLIHPGEYYSTNDVRNRILETTASRVRQFAVIEYSGSIETLVIETTPGKRKLEVLGIHPAPDDVGRYFKSLRE